MSTLSWISVGVYWISQKWNQTRRSLRCFSLQPLNLWEQSLWWTFYPKVVSSQTDSCRLYLCYGSIWVRSHKHASHVAATRKAANLAGKKKVQTDHTFFTPSYSIEILPIEAFHFLALLLLLWLNKAEHERGSEGCWNILVPHRTQNSQVATLRHPWCN